MSLRKIIDWAILYADADLVGIIASDFYQYSPDGINWMWACDVDIGGGQEVLQNVPVASNNRELVYAEQGKSVALKRMNDGKYVIVGLAKVSRGFGHIMYISVEDDIASVSHRGWQGYTIRYLTLGELGTIPNNAGEMGFGYLPFGQKGKFDGDGNLIELVEG